MNIRRRIALWICPELLDFRPIAGASAGKARKPEWASNADQVRRLDCTYRQLTGTVLNSQTAPLIPVCEGEVVGRFDWRPGYRYDMLILLARLWDKPASGVREYTRDRAIRYFATIWPEGAPWPSDIPRPAPLTEASR